MDTRESHTGNLVNPASPPELLVLGINHHQVPLEEREAFTLDAPAAEALLQTLKDDPRLLETAVLATCNRLEILAVAHPATSAYRSTESTLTSHLASATGQPVDRVSTLAIRKSGFDSVEHLFRVSAGLDSQMIGETEIFGQVKQAYKRSVDQQTAGRVLHKLFQRSFQEGKRVRSETAIGEGHVSVSTVAAELAERIFGDLSACGLLLLGTGDVAESTAKVFFSHGCRRVAVCGRNPKRLETLQQTLDADVHPMEDLPELMKAFDIVLASTAATTFLIQPAMVRQAVADRKTRPLFFIDVAMPRDVDPACAQDDRVFVYNLDDLAAVANENIAQRQKEVDRAAEKLHRAAREFWHKWGHA